MPLELIIREGDGPERRQLVPKQTAVVGRREDSDVVLPFSFVSARHGRVFLRGGLVHVEDMGSTNGTLVNGVALEPMVPRALGPNDLVEIDRLALRARWVEEAPADALPTFHETAPAALAPLPPVAGSAPAGVFEIQAGALSSAPPPPPPVLAVEARPVGPTAAPEPFARSSRTLARGLGLVGSRRFRLWSVGLQVVGLLAAVAALALLLVVLLA